MNLNDYRALHRASLDDPESFWREAARAIDWTVVPKSICEASEEPFVRWFSDGRLNTCFNAIDRHVKAGRGDQPALIYDSPVTGTKGIVSYAGLLRDVAQFAGGLRRLGVSKGDRVILYMPMIPETVVAMLACARIGAIHSVVFGGFAAKELASRIDDAEPKVLICGSCGIEPNRIVNYKPLVDHALELARHQPDTVIVFQRPQEEASLVAGRDIDWQDAIAGAQPAECVDVAATDPLYILYTSGTTGTPKGVVRDNGGHAVALAWSMKNIYGVTPGETYWAASDVGWVVGHSYIVYGPLLHGSTSVLYEGKPVGTPDPGAFWRVIAEHDVATMFTAPTAFRAIKRQDPGGKHLAGHDTSKLRQIFLAGERCDPDTLEWLQDLSGVPVVDHWWQTETGWPVCALPMGMAQLSPKVGAAGIPMPGWDVRCIDETLEDRAQNQVGAIVVKRPLPPATLMTIWNNDERFLNGYMRDYPGFYRTGDAGFIDEEGYVHIMGRTDDIINVAGHRLSTGAMEQVLASHPAVAECAVIGVPDALKGELPVGLLVLKDGASETEAQVVEDVIAMVREEVGPVAAFKRALVVDRLPKTRSGKILRGTMKKIGQGLDVPPPPTIDDPAIIDEIRIKLRG